MSSQYWLSITIIIIQPNFIIMLNHFTIIFPCAIPMLYILLPLKDACIRIWHCPSTVLRRVTIALSHYIIVTSYGFIVLSYFWTVIPQWFLNHCNSIRYSYNIPLSNNGGKLGPFQCSTVLWQLFIVTSHRSTVQTQS